LIADRRFLTARYSDHENVIGDAPSVMQVAKVLDLQSQHRRHERR